MRKLYVSVLLSVVLCASVGWTAPNLSWQDNSDNEDGFTVERTTIDPTCIQGFEEIAILGVNVVAFTDFIAVDKACYRVRAFNAAGFSAYTNTVQYLAPVRCNRRGKKCR